MKFAIVGCGTIGERRGDAMPTGSTIVGCYDVNSARAQKLAEKYKTQAFDNLEDLLNTSGCDIVIVAPINSVLVPTTQACLDHGKAVIVEKPAARSFQELRSLKVSENQLGKIKVGFNHRFHPAYQDLLSEVKKNSDDPIMFIRARYGNGARVGFDQEWRAKVDLAGGGELLDQGVHVLDLASGLVKDLEVVSGHTRTQYWKMDVDDNAWAILENKAGQNFSMHVSSTEWKNEFQFDVYTRNRKYIWTGLGRSYGPERLTIYHMKPEMGPPDVEKREYAPEDRSWYDENTNFVQALSGKAQLNGGLKDAENALRLVEQIYISSRKLAVSQVHPQWWNQKS
jgi:predicted dehydrogenase